MAFGAFGVHGRPHDTVKEGRRHQILHERPFSPKPVHVRTSAQRSSEVAQAAHVVSKKARFVEVGIAARGGATGQDIVSFGIVGQQNPRLGEWSNEDLIQRCAGLGDLACAPRAEFTCCADCARHVYRVTE
ncbi:hypothetical protein RRF57_012760 [Xylaria bambusicola]|uniref:Uncharacterized protein n=1 Tax=Xylaria bambusicola TaxID=326684 RepID=A0AAN7UX37_9PEZI